MLKTTTRFLRPSNVIRPFSTTTARFAAASPKMESYKKSGNRENAPPKHDMVHFPGLMSEKRSFGDFRTVLHTGLYSQIVAMEVPVNGEIGDEVHTVDQMYVEGREGK
jgi:hypothetical protein